MENIWNEMYSAAKAVLDPRKISDIVEAVLLPLSKQVRESYIQACALTVPALWAFVPKEMRFST